MGLAFDSERFDTATMHNTVTNNSRITFTTAGIYVVTASVEWLAISTIGRRQVGIRLNGSTVIALQSAPAANDNQPLTVTTIYKVAADAYVECVVYQSSAGSLQIGQGSAYSPEFAATWIGLG